MMSKKKAGALAAALCSSVVLMDASSASAGSLLDLFFPKRVRSQDTMVQPNIAPALTTPTRSGFAAGNDPLPRVKAPSYYTYKADPMRVIATSRFADPVLTSAVNTVPATPAITATDAQPLAAIDATGDQRRSLADAHVLATDIVAKAIEAYYGDNRPLIWVAGNQMNDRARSALQALAAADTVGLDSSDYNVTVPALDFDATNIPARNRELMQFEIALSSKVLTYVQDAVRGRLDPNRISGYHDFKRKDVSLDAALKILSLSPDAGAYMTSRNPSNAEFAALAAELSRLRANGSDAPPPVRINLTGLLKPGQSNPELANIVAGIRQNGSETLRATHAPLLASYTGSPDYSPEVVALVEDYQKEVGLKPDGVIGRSTVSKLVGTSNDGKVDKLVVAMEQLRWMPKELGARYVFINQPAFTASYHNDNREQLSMRVVVGGPRTQTYFFNDEIETVELHPYWGVPASIIINEMLPKLRQDPSYLDKLGYEVTYAGQPVSSSEINWMDTKKVGVRQPPGSDNALGELKILFPNAHSIYMHDTPSKSFFKKDMRALSHGCVRLQDPRGMAAAVLGTTVADIGKQLENPANRALPVPGKIPVYVSYFTAWPDKNGVIQYYDDVYGRDEFTRKALATTNKARQV